MIAVVVLAILSVVAGVSYRKYIYKARTTEAITYLAHIKMKQETYFQTYGQYVDTSSSGHSYTDSDFYPSEPSKSQEMDMKWEIDCPDDAAQYPGWCALGVRPTSETIRFQYVTVGWASGDSDPDEHINDPDRRWWYAVARSDMDRNHVYSTFILTSEITEPMMFKETE